MIKSVANSAEPGSPSVALGIWVGWLRDDRSDAAGAQLVS
jgi:hypothetical protein